MVDIPKPKKWEKRKPGEKERELHPERWESPSRIDRLAGEGLIEPRRVRAIPRRGITREKPYGEILPPAVRDAAFDAREICNILVTENPDPTPADHKLCARAKKLAWTDPTEFKKVFREFLEGPKR